MQTIQYNTVLRLAENLTKITEKEFQILEKINNEDSWNNFDDLERLVNDYITGDFKVINMPLKDYANLKIRNEIDSWLDENEKAEIVNTVLESLDNNINITDFTDYETGKEYTLIYNNFEVETLLYNCDFKKEN